MDKTCFSSSFGSCSTDSFQFYVDERDPSFYILDKRAAEIVRHILIKKEKRLRFKTKVTLSPTEQKIVCNQGDYFQLD